MRRCFFLLFVLLLLFLPSLALAQDAERSTVDIVHLKNGTQVRGQITELIPEDHVTIVVENETKRFAWSEVEKVATIDAPPITNKTPGPPPKPVTPANLDAPPAESPPPQPQWRPNGTLMTTGAIVLAVGYGGPGVVALPSTVGLLGRIVILVLTLGLPCWFNNSDDYLCDAEHGSVQMLVPFIGPILFAENHPHDDFVNENGRPLDSGVKGVLYASSILQVAGLATMITGLATGKKELMPPEKKAGTYKPKLFVVPLDMPNAAGLTVGVHHW